MKISLIFTGKTTAKYLKTGIDLYKKRLLHYIKLRVVTIPDLKNTKKLSQNQVKEKQCWQIKKKLENVNYVILLDEAGEMYSSDEFAAFIQKRMNSGIKQLAFVIGGAYGFDKNMAKELSVPVHKISLSKMTFSHQMVRLFFIEQLYRAMTILRGQPYHHS